jgi:hypothetical protein
MREGLCLFVEGSDHIPCLDLLNRLPINKRASGETLVDNHETITKQFELFEVFGSGYRLNAGDRNGRSPFVFLIPNLPNDRHWINHSELVGRLLEQLGSMGNDQRIEAKPVGNFGKDDRFPRAGGKDDQRPPSLCAALVCVEHTFNTGLLVGTKSDERCGIGLSQG